VAIAIDPDILLAVFFFLNPRSKNQRWRHREKVGWSSKGIEEHESEGEPRIGALCAR
jgi:hypothetical protein